jgi:cyanate lyase
MSLARAEGKLKEFFYYVSASVARWLSDAHDALKRFYESEDARLDLMTSIRMAIKDSLVRACEERVINVDMAVHLFGDIMMYYGSYLTKIVADADISALISFLEEAIKNLKLYSRYAEWARKSWEGAMEILRMIFKI